MIFICADCGVACFCDADDTEPDTWPVCTTCTRIMAFEEVLR